jgi:hypothetical protein
MRSFTIKLFIVVALLSCSGSAFASFSYNINVNTNSLSGTKGYLYFEYLPVAATRSTATVSGFTTTGSLGSQDFNGVVNGGAVSGTLPGPVIFANTYSTNDYNQAITFGGKFNFTLSFTNPAAGGQAGGSSSFLLGVYADNSGVNPLANKNGYLNSIPGTLFSISLMNTGAISQEVFENSTTITPTPIPAAVWLFGSGIISLAGLRRNRRAK